MSIQIYSSLSRTKTPFQALKEGHVSMYVCGPTVYSDCHIGHIMGPVLFDSVARWFKQRNYTVQFVNNITDIDDKIIKRHLETGEAWKDITVRYTQQYFDLLEALNVTTVTNFPKCTDYIDNMVNYIQDLMDDDKAYVADDGVYFDVVKHKGYGKLSGRKLEDMLSSGDKRADLRDSADFCLWKLAKSGEPSWESPWGAGRPGWHIECSVMASELLGDTFDIHGGGDDLKFPHHENEICQGEAHGGDYAKCWMHNGLIEYEGVKVGKSDPRMQDANFRLQFNALHLLKTHGAQTLRYFLLQGHYRRPFDFAPKGIEAAGKALGRLEKTIRSLVPAEQEALSFDQISQLPLPEKSASCVANFAKSLDDDFNTGGAVAQIFSLVASAKGVSKEEQVAIYTVADQLAKVLGLELNSSEASTAGQDDEVLDKVMQLVIKLRQKARANKDYAASDEIRDDLAAVNIELKDSPEGCNWQFKS